ncbi:MAG TPA: LamG-like jellyroll fold domain-containing protein, partial [Verrucomicrobiae bacterium]|nr:LamG-like jellyroll fold domain-containing protein [Verrucomicrobiae bacterium]
GDTLNPDHITIAAWVKAADHDGFWNRIVDKDWRNGYCLSLGGDYNGKAHRGKPTFETSRGEIELGRVLGDYRWHHVAATYDGQHVRVFVDGGWGGHPVKTAGSLKKSGWDLCIGNSVVDYGTGEFLAFDGLIDEVRVYNRALSPEEIKALATATRAGVDVLPVPTPAPAAKPDAAARLKQVKQLYDQGLINKDEYDRKVKEIMDSL